MKERPIIMARESVNAILAGRKTQTRRVVRRAAWMTREPLWDAALAQAGVIAVPYPDAESQPWPLHCPHGEPGDRLWVRERWADALDIPGWECICYSADFGTERNFLHDRWRPAIFMPRSASRLTLEIVRVRAERLQKASFGDVLNEGIAGDDDFPGQPFGPALLRAWEAHWDALNAKRGFPWATNPWVWVIEFRKVAP